MTPEELSALLDQLAENFRHGIIDERLGMDPRLFEQPVEPVKHGSPMLPVPVDAPAA